MSKNPDKPKFIDLMFTNKNRIFQNFCVSDTGLSQNDCHYIKISFEKIMTPL